MDNEGILRSLGQRLRDARGKTGQSLSGLARDAGVSRRYLTDVEAGRGNPSLLVLASLARAVGMPMAKLLDFDLRGRTSERIALVGLRGAGKSTVGKLLALELEAPFVELDQRVEAIAGLSLAEIFDLHGQGAYRRFEAEALEQVLAEGERAVIATGGSLVTSPKTYPRLLDTCRVVWLRAKPESHFARVQEQGDARPMKNHPRAMEELQALLEKRTPLYRRAEHSFDTDEFTPAELALELARTL